MAKPKTIASKDLKNFLESTKRETRLMGAIERHILSQPFDDRDQSYIHPSDIIKPEWCALSQYHALMGNFVETKDKPTLRLRRIFDTGHDAHARWQNHLRDMGVLYGNWSRGIHWYKSSDLPMPDLEYEEVTLVSAKHMIRGHADGWVKGLGEDFLIEIKTIGEGTIRAESPALLAQYDNSLAQAWKNIKTPFKTHMLQGQMYLHLCHLMVEEGIIPEAPKEIVFIYDLKATQEYKEFVVSYNPDFVADIFDKALDVVWAVNNSRPPLCSIDIEKGCKRCAPFRAEDVPSVKDGE